MLILHHLKAQKVHCTYETTLAPPRHMSISHYLTIHKHRATHHSKIATTTDLALIEWSKILMHWKGRGSRYCQQHKIYTAGDESKSSTLPEVHYVLFLAPKETTTIATKPWLLAPAKLGPLRHASQWHFPIFLKGHTSLKSGHAPTVDLGRSNGMGSCG